MYILAINPGSTSTKIAIYNDTEEVARKNIQHDANQLAAFGDVTEQYSFRKQLVMEQLNKLPDTIKLSAVIGRGGLAQPVEGGVYEVTPRMLELTRQSKHKHVCDLGCLMAYEIAKEIPGCQCYIADPGMVDEMNSYARISGSPLLPRVCVWHALNQRAIAKRFAREHGTRYEDLNLIICHLGGGISIAAHDHGRAVDANNALDGEGPFGPERTGSLPVADLVKLCFSGKYTQTELLDHISRKGGVMAYLGTNDMIENVRRVENGDKEAHLIVNAMIYDTAKFIASYAPVLYGKVDAIILTGGLAHSEYIVNGLKERLSFLAPIHIYPGEDEMQALAFNALEALQGKTEIKYY